MNKTLGELFHCSTTPENFTYFPQCVAKNCHGAGSSNKFPSFFNFLTNFWKLLVNKLLKPFKSSTTFLKNYKFVSSNKCHDYFYCRFLMPRFYCWISLLVAWYHLLLFCFVIVLVKSRFITTYNVVKYAGHTICWRIVDETSALSNWQWVPLSVVVSQGS